MGDSLPGPLQDGQTLRDVAHTHPHTGRPFGAHLVFARGGALVADPDRSRARLETGGDEPASRSEDSRTPPIDGEE